MKTTTVIISLTVVTLVLVGLTMRHSSSTTEAMSPKEPVSTQTTIATFAGGCFWCMEPPFEKFPGVVEVLSGYIGGTGLNPTYEDYAVKGYIEAIQVTYDPAQVTYAQLLEVFWRQIDPTDAGGQFVDRGPQYRSAIFYHDDEQKRLAEQSEKELDRSGRFGKPLVTEIVTAPGFYRAEEYHQDFYKNSPVRYRDYRLHSGRDAYLQKIWGKDKTATLSQNELKKKLSPLQNGTEPPFHNDFWNNERRLRSIPETFREMTHGKNAGHELEPDSVLHIWQSTRTRATGREMALPVTGARLPRKESTWNL